MRSVNIAELKNSLSACLGEVRRGEEIVVRDRDVPFAKIVPLFGADDVASEERALVAAGKLRLPSGPLPRSFWSLPAPRVAARSVLAALLAERADD